MRLSTLFPNVTSVVVWALIIGTVCSPTISGIAARSSLAELAFRAKLIDSTQATKFTFEFH